MKLLIPISYFFGKPTSELWQLDTKTHEQKLLTKLPASSLDVKGKGFTGIAWINNHQLVGCDFNRVFIIDRISCKQTNIIHDDQYNDLHHVSVSGSDIYIANTGRDTVEVLDHNLQTKARINLISDSQILQRINGQCCVDDEYYDESSIEFCSRKVADTWHINHIIRANWQLDEKLIATSFKNMCMIDAITREQISNTFPEQPHDGFIDNEYMWATSVCGKVYRSILSFPLDFELMFDLFKDSKFKGWCRGLLITEKSLFIGITAIYKESHRTSWLNCPIESTRTGIYRVDIESLTIDDFYDFSHPNGSRIFTIIKDQ